MVVATDLPLSTAVHVDPELVLRRSEPSELPAISSWLFTGSTANPKMAECPWCGSGFRATHVEGARASANTPIAARVTSHKATNVAARRGPRSDTSLPIITQHGLPGTRGQARFAYNPLRAGSSRGRAGPRRIQTGFAAEWPDHRNRIGSAGDRRS